MSAILLVAVDHQDELAWEELLAIAPRLDDAVGEAWCLIGAQMVRAHAAMRGAQPPRISRDLDLLADHRSSWPDDRSLDARATLVALTDR